jgi:putative transposase
MKKRLGPEQIIPLLRQADVALGKGQKVPEVCKQLGISEQTYYRWRTKYGGMDPQMARQLQGLQKENARLKRLVADQALDNQILREAARPNWRALSGGVGPWKRSAVAWGRNPSRNDGSAVYWGSLVRRSATVVASRTMTAG